jgi:uncharacterized protein (DUF58 family)
MPSLLVKVKKKMSIYAHRKVRTVLDGEYGSVFKGRSMDFDDLREYVVGDDVKDIDWKGTARSGRTLIRRYIAVRKHNVLLAVNTGHSMSAAAPDGTDKRDATIMAAGVIAYIVQKHGDLIALVSGDSSGVNYIPLKGSAPHMEQILQKIQRSTTSSSAKSNLPAILDYVVKMIRRRVMMIIITDTLEISPETEVLLRRLRAQHEIMFVHIDDRKPTEKGDKIPIDIESEQIFPDFVRRNRHFIKEAEALDDKTWSSSKHLLDHLGITYVRIDSEQNVINRIIELLERQKHVKR